MKDHTETTSPGQEGAEFDFQIKTRQYVECAVCGKEHDTESTDFRTFHGNVYVGMHGGVVGNNLDKGGRVRRAQYCCAAPGCIATFLNILQK